jgi:phage-related minor tail protein
VATKVGDLYYEVTVDTSKMIEGNKAAEKSNDALEATLTQTAAAAKIHAAASAAAAVAVREAAKAADQGAASAGKLGAATDKATISAKQLTAATRGLPAQFTDIAVSLQAGQNPLTVLLQQGGQLKDMFGGAGAAAKAMGTYIAGLVTPLSVAAAAVVTFLVGLTKGQAEMSEFNRATVLTGGASRATADDLNAMAASLDNVAGVTRGQAAEAIGEMVNAGIRGRESIMRFTEAAIRLEQAGGPAIEKTAEQFKALEKDPLAASVKLNESVNFLTDSLYQQIKSLEEQGRHTEAARVAQNAYADAINARAPQILDNLGLIERGWKAIGNAAREAWDGVLSVGRTASLSEQLAKAQAELDKLQNRKSGWAFGMTQKDRDQAIEDQRQIVAGIQEQMRMAARSATQQGEQADRVRALAAWDKEGLQYLDKKAKMEREIAQTRQEGLAAGRSEVEIEARIAAIREKYAEKVKKPRKEKEPFDEAAYLASLRKAQESELQVVTATEDERLRIAKKNLDAKKISEEAYNEAVTLIVLAAEEERQALLAKAQQKVDAERLQADAKAARDRAKVRKGRDEAADAIAAVNPIDKIREDEAQKIAVMEQYRQQDLAYAQIYEDAKAAIRKKANDDVAAYEAKVQAQQLSNYSDLFGAMAGVTKAFAGEQSSAYKAMFAVSKGFAIAESIVAIQTGIAKASSEKWPLNLAAMGSVAAATAGIVSTIKGTNYGGGRQYGGPASAGAMYRVNETGRPEMFTAANGSQYMLPTANGNVTPASEVGQGGGQAWNIIINNAPPGTTASVDQQSRTVEIAVAAVAEQFATNTGPVWSAARSGTNIQPRM